MSDNFTDIHNFVKESQTLLSWQAPMRPYKKSGKRVLRFFLAVALLLSIIVFFFGDRMLLLPVWASLFLFYILTITPPPIIENKISKFGLESAGITIRWDMLDKFYFTQRWGFDILVVATKGPYPLQAYFVVPDNAIKQKIATLVGEHLVYVTHPRKTFTDRLVNFFSKLVPEEEEDTQEKSKKHTFGVA